MLLPAGELGIAPPAHTTYLPRLTPALASNCVGFRANKKKVYYTTAEERHSQTPRPPPHNLAPNPSASFTSCLTPLSSKMLSLPPGIITPDVSLLILSTLSPLPPRVTASPPKTRTASRATMSSTIDACALRSAVVPPSRRLASSCERFSIE